MFNTADVNVKWSHQGVFRRFQLPRSGGYTALLDKVKAVVPDFRSSLAYKDEDGDMIIFSSSEELDHAISINGSQSLFRIFTVEPFRQNNELEMEESERANRDVDRWFTKKQVKRYEEAGTEFGPADVFVTNFAEEKVANEEMFRRAFDTISSRFTKLIQETSNKIEELGHFVLKHFEEAAQGIQPSYACFTDDAPLHDLMIRKSPEASATRHQLPEFFANERTPKRSRHAAKTRSAVIARRSGGRTAILAGASFLLPPPPVNDQSNRLEIGASLQTRGDLGSEKSTAARMDENMAGKVSLPEAMEVGDFLLCPICGSTLKDKENYKQHCQRAHGYEKKEIIIECCVDGCTVHTTTIASLGRHLEEKHEFKARYYENVFEDEFEYENFVFYLNNEETASFVAQGGPKGNLSTTIFYCRRSGKARTNDEQDTMTRSTRKTVRTGKHCPAYYTKTILPDGKVKVVGQLRHAGHDMDISLVPLSDRVRRYMEDLLRMGVSIEEVPKKVRTEFASDPKMRDYHVKKSDVRYLARKLGIAKFRYEQPDSYVLSKRVIIKE